MSKYDVAVIGSGPGGYVAAIRAAQLGLKTVCIEKDKTLGGTCLNVGCIPSKALLQSSEHYAWLQHDAKSFGIGCKEISLDFDQMMKRKEEIVKGLVQGVPVLFKHNGVESVKGIAKVLGTGQIEVTQDGKKQLIESQHIILATGSESIALPFLPIDEQRIVTSTGALALKKVPKKMIVIGGGVIGVELASVYNRLGCEVTIVEMLDRICINMDEALSKSLLQILKKQGIQFLLSSKVKQAEIGKDKIAIQIEQNGKDSSIDAEVVLVAIGRRAYSQGLGLQELNMKMDKRFVAVDQQFMTSLPNVYAIGDLIDGPMLAHRASDEGYVLAEILAGKKAQVNYMTVPSIIYTNPEAAAVGLTEAEAREKGLDIVIGTAFFRGNPRARCISQTDGFVKVIGVGADKLLIGMHILGPQASELIHTGMLAIGKKISLLELAHAPFGHPTLSEAIKEACGNALGCAIHTP